MSLISSVRLGGAASGRGLFSAVRGRWAVSRYALLALLFGVGLELIFALQRWVYVVAAAVVAVVGLGVLLLRLEEGGQFRFIHSILPLLATAGLSGFAFLLPTTALLHVYVAGAGVFFFLLLKHGARAAYPLWNWLMSLVVYFLTISFVLGLRFHLDLPVVPLLTAVGAATALISLQALARISQPVRDSLVPVLGLTLALSEVTWVLQFLPVHYLVQASVISALYYVMFNLMSVQALRGVERRDLIEYVGIGLVALLLVLISAQWK